MIRKNNVNYFKAFMSAMAVMLVVVMSSSVFAKTTLVKMRMGQGEDKTRVVFEIKQNHRFEITTLKNPARIVVDFYKADNQLTFSKMKFLDARVKQARVKNQAKRTRVVLDLRDDFDYNYFTLAKNKSGAERVVIDVSNRKAAKQVAKTLVKKATKPVKQTVVAKKTAPKKVTRKVAQTSFSAKPKTNKPSHTEDIADNHT
ncbi:MAG: AMIN domain-containing protein, partial [Hydrogenovibrio crunogenus]|nr:AMIN domain-containing protein [Hydrogenovibrio crunogenus]